MIEKQKREMDAQNLLMSALHFTDDDLEENRVGRLSPQQQRHLQRNFNGSASVYSGLYGISTTIGFFILMAFGAQLIDFRQTGIWLGILVLVVVGVRYLIRMVRQPMEDDLKTASVAAIEGVAVLDITQSGAYSLAIGDQSFLLSQAKFLAFKNREPYRIYYLPYSRTLLSAECLR